MFRIVKSLSERILPDHDNPEALADDFAQHFHTEIANIRASLYEFIYIAYMNLLMFPKTV